MTNPLSISDQQEMVVLRATEDHAASYVVIDTKLRSANFFLSPDSMYTLLNRMCESGTLVIWTRDDMGAPAVSITPAGKIRLRDLRETINGGAEAATKPVLFDVHVSEAALDGWWESIDYEIKAELFNHFWEPIEEEIEKEAAQ